MFFFLCEQKRRMEEERNKEYNDMLQRQREVIIYTISFLSNGLKLLQYYEVIQNYSG